MTCLICRDLERTLDFRRSKYFEARSAAYYQVSTKLAAQKNVDMERAKTDLEEHQMACDYVAKTTPSLSKSSQAGLDSSR